jgi:hypothetical protein
MFGIQPYLEPTRRNVGCGEIMDLPKKNIFIMQPNKNKYYNNSA